MMTCPFCGRDPFYRSDMGEALAVECCDLGDLYFRGARPELTECAILEPDEFRSVGDRIQSMKAELEAYCDLFGELPSNGERKPEDTCSADSLNHSWHPIETAPKEGRFLVGWWGDYGGGEREFVWFVADGPLGDGGVWKHWYPVPHPPIEEKGE